MSRKRNEQGQYADRIEPDEVLGVFNTREDIARPVTATDVTEALGIARRTAHNKLNALVERGELKTRKVGARGRVWWTPVSREAVARAAPRNASQRREAPASDPADRTAVSEGTSPETAHTAEEDVDKNALADLEFPDSRDRDQCESAVRAARAYLREHGPATMRELVANVMPAHTVGYNVPELEPGERYRGGWWRLVVKPGLEALEDVESPPRGASEWRHVSNGSGVTSVRGDSGFQDTSQGQ